MNKEFGFVVAEDHPIVRQGIKLLLSFETRLKWLGDTGRGDEVIDLLLRTQADLLILDLGLPGMQGLDALRRARELPQPPLVVVLTARQDAAALQAALELGAQGYLLKADDTDELLRALRIVIDGGCYVSPLLVSDMRDLDPSPSELTQREREIVAAIVAGASSKIIAFDLGISEHTVRKHRENIARKLNFRNPAQLVAWALQHL